jgi:hypothetical protein
MATLCDAMPPEDPMVGDEEELVGDDFAEAFSSTPYHLAHSTLSLNKAYVLHVSANVGHSRHRFGTKMLVDLCESKVKICQHFPLINAQILCKYPRRSKKMPTCTFKRKRRKLYLLNKHAIPENGSKKL